MSLIGAGSDLLPRFLVPNPGEESLLRRHGPSDWRRVFSGQRCSGRPPAIYSIGLLPR